MITDSCYNRHQVTNSSGDFSIQSKKVVPGIGTCWHVIVISYVTSHEKNIGLESADYFR